VEVVEKYTLDGAKTFTLMKYKQKGQGSPNFFVRGPHKVLQNSSRAGHLEYCVWFGIRYTLSNQQSFRKYIIFSLL